MPAEYLNLADPAYQQVVAFLYREARLLDHWELPDWLTLLTEDIVYLMPVRVTLAKKDGPGFVEELNHFEENLMSLKVRVRRWKTQFAWAEDPPPRTRRFVSNILVSSGGKEDELKVSSNLLLVRSRGDTPDLGFLSAERQDVIRQTPDGLRLARRVILVDQSVLGLENLVIL